MLKRHRLRDDYTDADGCTDYETMWADLRPDESDLDEIQAAVKNARAYAKRKLAERKERQLKERNGR